MWTSAVLDMAWCDIFGPLRSPPLTYQSELLPAESDCKTHCRVPESKEKLLTTEYGSSVQILGLCLCQHALWFCRAPSAWAGGWRCRQKFTFLLSSQFLSVSTLPFHPCPAGIPAPSQSAGSWVHPHWPPLHFASNAVCNSVFQHMLLDAIFCCCQTKTDASQQILITYRLSAQFKSIFIAVWWTYV